MPPSFSFLISRAIHAPSSRSSEAWYAWIFSPSPAAVNSRLSFRRELRRTTAFAALRMCPVLR